MGGRRDDDAGPRRPGRTTPQPSATLVVGFVLAGVAILAIFVTDDANYLRLAVLAGACGCVLAAVAAGRRGADKTAVAAREAELRRAFEHQLDREEAAHREMELQLENDVRREAEESVRSELDALRREIAALSSMRGDVRGISVLREQLAALPALREELARMSALRGEVAALHALRDDVEALADLGKQFGALRAEVGRLRTDLTEQLATWTPQPPRELSGGPGMDDVLATIREHERVPAEPVTAEVTAIPAERPRPQPFPRYERSLPPNDYARRPAADPDDDVTTGPLLRQTPAARPPAPVVQDPAPTGPVYVSEILAEQGTPPPGSRRRRRYRDENTEDDVLSRVLGQH